MTIDELSSIVQEAYGNVFSIDELYSKSRKMTLPDARAIVCYVAHEILKYSYPTIGKSLNRTSGGLVRKKQKVDDWIKNPKLNKQAVDVLNKTIMHINCVETLKNK